MEDVPGDDGDVHRALNSNNCVGSSSSMYGGRDVHMFHCHDLPLKVRDPKVDFSYIIYQLLFNLKLVSWYF